jgi:hypothetical protein
MTSEFVTHFATAICQLDWKTCDGDIHGDSIIVRNTSAPGYSPMRLPNLSILNEVLILHIRISRSCPLSRLKEDRLQIGHYLHDRYDERELQIGFDLSYPERIIRNSSNEIPQMGDSVESHEKLFWLTALAFS